MDCFVVSLLAMTVTAPLHTEPSYPAHAGYPVRCGLSIPSLTPRNTGSPAGACHRAAIRPTRWLAMTSKHTFTPSPRDAPEPLMNLSPKEGVGNVGCPLHPRPRVHLVVVERTRVTTSTPESPDVPARNGFNGFLRALPGDRALLPPSPCGLKVLSSPVEPNEPPQDLTPASRRQDHTTSPSASSAVVLHAANRSRRAIRPALASHAQHCRVHRIPPRVRDDHDTPLWWGGMARVLDVIWGKWEQKYFSENQK